MDLHAIRFKHKISIVISLLVMHLYTWSRVIVVVVMCVYVFVFCCLLFFVLTFFCMKFKIILDLIISLFFIHTLSSTKLLIYSFGPFFNILIDLYRISSFLIYFLPVSPCSTSLSSLSTLEHFLFFHFFFEYLYGFQVCLSSNTLY